jgi:hypothetical protein
MAFPSFLLNFNLRSNAEVPVTKNEDLAVVTEAAVAV